MAKNEQRRLAAAPASVLPPCRPPWPPTPAHTIVQNGRAFHPAEVTINNGESLTFTNNDSSSTRSMSIGLFDSEEKSPGENLTESFTQAGTFQVRCHIHPKMQLIVHVK